MQRFKPLVGLLAATAAIIAGAAHAQCAAPIPTTNVTIYGLIDAAVRRPSNVTAAGDSVTTMEDGIFTGSRFGLRGTEDLGGGLRAVVTMESGFDPGTGGSLQGATTADYGQEAASPRFWGREVYVGLQATGAA